MSCGLIEQTQVRTLSGTRPIQKLTFKEVVASYAGSVVTFGVVTNLNKVSVDTVYKITTSGSEITVAPEQKIRSNGQFIVATDLNVGDSVDCEGGTTQTITNIEQLTGQFNVVVITVDKCHTFVANNIIVHNGGDDTASTPIIESDTINSTQTARIVEVISEGPIVGLVGDGMQSVYFNDTPVQNSDNTYNFNVSQFTLRTGTDDQEYVPGFNGVESVTAVSAPVTYSTPVVQTMDSETDSAIVQIRFPSGLKQQETNGDLHGYAVSFSFETKATSSAIWSPVSTETINDKASSGFDMSYRITRPTDAVGVSWDIRVSRLTADSASDTIVDEFSVYQITQIQEINLAYPGVAYAVLAIEAETQNQTIPVRAYEVLGMIIKVPSNYDSILRTYTGTWDGSFKEAWTNNPAWVVYDLLTNTKYGMGNETTLSNIDVWSFYQAAVHNDELVDDGNGGTEPRYTFNNLLVTAETNWNVLQNVASSCNAVVVAGGTISLLQDRPASPVAIVTNSNVKDGVFNYTSSALSTRATCVNTTFNDKTDKYLSRTVSVDDAEAISRYGYNTADIVAYGATSEGQAIRAGKWYMYTQLNQTQAVDFEVGFNMGALLPGDVFYLVDNDYIGETYAGRIVGGSVSSVEIDTPFTIQAGHVYKLTIVDEDNVTFHERTITNTAGQTSTFTLNSNLSLAPTAGQMWMVTCTSLLAERMFRVLSITENSRGVFKVVALEYDENKYAIIEDDITVPDLVYSTFNLDVCLPVSNIQGVLRGRIDAGTGLISNIAITWDASPSTNVVKYLVRYKKNSNSYSDVYTVYQPELTLENVGEGTYTVMVQAVNVKGVTSASTVDTFNVSYSGTTNNLHPPINLAIENGYGSGTVWTGKDLHVVWEANSVNDTILSETVGGYHIFFYRDGTHLIHDEIVGKDVFKYTLSQVLNNDSSGGPYREITVKVFTVNAFVVESVDCATGVFTNAAPGVVNNIVVQDTLYGGLITYDKPTDTDYKGVIVWVSDVSGFTPSASTVVSDGDVTLVQLGALTGPVYVRVAAYDDFGKSYDGNELNVSGQFTITPLSISSSGIPNGPTNPTTGNEGDVFFNTTDGKLYRYHSGAWTAEVVVSDIDGQISSAQLADNAVTGDKIAASVVVASKIADNAVTGDKIAANAVVASKIATDAVTSDKIYANAVIASKIATDAVTSDKIYANAVIASKIAANAVTSDKIYANAVTSDKILAGAVTASKIDVTNLAAIKAALGDVTSGTLTLNGAGYIRGGQGSYNTGTGYWLGYDSGAYKFSIGNSGGHRLTFDGSTLTLTGNLNGAGGTFAGALSAATGTFSGTLTASAVNAVNTINIAGNAVTVPISSNAGASYTNSLYFNPQGGIPLIWFSVDFYATNTNTYTITLYRDGVAVKQFSGHYGPAFAGSMINVCELFVDYAHWGATYSVSVSTNGPAVLSNVMVGLSSKK